MKAFQIALSLATVLSLILLLAYLFELDNRIADVDDRLTYIEARNMQYASE